MQGNVRTCNRSFPHLRYAHVRTKEGNSNDGDDDDADDDDDDDGEEHFVRPERSRIRT